MKRHGTITRSDAIRNDGSAVAVVKHSVDALRTVRTSMLELAYELERRRELHGYLVLVEPSITEELVRIEWQRSMRVVHPDIAERLTVCMIHGESAMVCEPLTPTSEVQSWLRGVIRAEGSPTPGASSRIDYDFVIRKLLMLRWLTTRDHVTAAWVIKTAGCSYPTVARVVKELGSLVERASDRRISLTYFPVKELERLVARADRARSTVRFVDRSGQPRSPEMQLRRMMKLGVANVAVGGVIGARHYVPDLDMVGAPTLDLSVHCHDAPFDLRFVGEMDPALKIEEDPLKPANVVVHAVRHADAMFSKGESNLLIADPMECLLDLHEGHLESQAAQFLSELERAGRRTP